tara:strand:+ start:295 stop:522 length:228 start_codon:yes stop_codon:yes gene_type:complete
MNKPIRTYDGYLEILDNVRMIIRMHAPEESVVMLNREINRLEDEISEMLTGRAEQEVRREKNDSQLNHEKKIFNE